MATVLDPLQVHCEDDAARDKQQNPQHCDGPVVRHGPILRQV